MKKLHVWSEIRYRGVQPPHGHRDMVAKDIVEGASNALAEMYWFQRRDWHTMSNWSKWSGFPVTPSWSVIAKREPRKWDARRMWLDLERKAWQPGYYHTDWVDVIGGEG